jgi:small subunit ribosomal protein S7
LRGKKAKKRRPPPDIKYNSVQAAKFINKLMLKGKKSVAERIFYDALDIVQKKTGEEPFEVFQKALENAKPLVEVKSRRMGGSTYQVPIEIPSHKQEEIGMRWVIQFTRKRKGRPMHEKLALELLDAYNNTGASVKKREDTHKMAEANKAFAHYRW